MGTTMSIYLMTGIIDPDLAVFTAKVTVDAASMTFVGGSELASGIFRIQLRFHDDGVMVGRYDLDELTLITADGDVLSHRSFA